MTSMHADTATALHEGGKHTACSSTAFSPAKGFQWDISTNLKFY